MRIGRYWVTQRGGRWLVMNGSTVISSHGTKWAALKTAKAYSWAIHTQNKPADQRRQPLVGGQKY